MTYPLAYPLASIESLGFYLQIAGSCCNSGDDSLALMEALHESATSCRTCRRWTLPHSICLSATWRSWPA